MSRKKLKQAPKRVLRLPDLDFTKSAVLNTLRSTESKRSYRFAIEDFVDWYCSEPRLAFNKTVVLRYRLELENRRLSSSTINLRLAAVRRLAYEPPTRVCSARTWPPGFGASKVRSELASGWAIGSVPSKSKRWSGHPTPRRCSVKEI